MLLFNGILIVFLLSFHLLYSSYTNILWRNAAWDSSKVKMEKGLMGAWSFILTYRSLAHDRLDLGSWHGHQEVFLKDTVDYNTLRLSFRLADSAYLVVHYAKEGDTLYSFRLSTDPRYPSAWLGIYHNAFIYKDIVRAAVQPNEWQQLILHKGPKGTSLFLDSNFLALHSQPDTLHPVTGLRGSGQTTLVDDIYLLGEEGNTLFYEEFSKKYHHFLLYFLFLVLSNGAFILLYRQRRWLIPLAFNLTVLVIALTAFFLIYGVERYPQPWMIRWKEKVSTIEEARVVGERIELEGSLNQDDSVLRVLFIGSSQTWGAGASADSLCLVKRFASLLSDTLGGDSVHAINAGISGMNSDVLLEMYRNDWASLHPDFVIVNFGYNDSGNPRFGDNMKAIARIARERESMPVFIQEPLDKRDTLHEANLVLIRSLANVEQIPVVDMHHIIRQYEDEGFLYWDFIHLTDFGQEIFARELLKAFVPLLPANPEMKLSSSGTPVPQEKP
jgi:lysophospholipase L1-like esterase